MLNRFMEAYVNRQDGTDAIIRNHQASIKNIETKIRKLTKLMNERLPYKNPDPKPQRHVMSITTKEDTIFEPLVILNEALK